MTKQVVDLFAGGGGTSTGVVDACKELGFKIELTAINHWAPALATHKANHPWARHIETNVEDVYPPEIVPGGRLDLLVGSPECSHHSKAAGGRPKLDQKRASGWHIMRWLEHLEVRNILIENVPEYQDWCRVDQAGRPIKSEKGMIYQSWLAAIRSFGYTVDTKILNAADYGAATSRKRLFILAKKGRGQITWPIPSRAKDGTGRRKWRAAREILDLDLKGQSIFTRKRPLVPKTIDRIKAGLWKFGGEELRPFLVLMENGGGIQSLDLPLKTITGARGGTMALATPEFILSQGSGGAPRSIDEPSPTQTTKGAPTLIKACLVHYHGGNASKHPERRFSSIDEPLPPQDTTNRFGKAEAFILPVRGFYGQNTAKSIDQPLGTITQRGYGSVVEAFVLSQGSNGAPRSVENPLPTIVTGGKIALIDPCLIQYNGNSGAQSVDDPLGTVTTKDRFALIQPEIDGYRLEIYFRMLQPYELSASMGFPKGYQFKGKKTEVVKQIGNAVAVPVAKALALSLLAPRSAS